MLVARYVSPAEMEREQQAHKLVRGATLFNIEAQRWINPIKHGDRLGWFIGKVVLLHFWATWSPGSVEQLAHYDELYKKHKDQGLVVIAIHSAEEAAVSNAQVRVETTQRYLITASPVAWTTTEGFPAINHSPEEGPNVISIPNPFNRQFLGRSRRLC